MLFALLVLETPRIGPPPNVGPLKPELEFELELELENGLELGFAPPAPPGEFGSSVVSASLPLAFCVNVGWTPPVWLPSAASPAWI
jgi:hypothetical protein